MNIGSVAWLALPVQYYFLELFLNLLPLWTMLPKKIEMSLEIRKFSAKVHLCTTIWAMPGENFVTRWLWTVFMANHETIHLCKLITLSSYCCYSDELYGVYTPVFFNKIINRVATIVCWGMTCDRIWCCTFLTKQRMKQKMLLLFRWVLASICSEEKLLRTSWLPWTQIIFPKKVFNFAAEVHKNL